MITIYHNPKCSKSRQGVKYLEEKKLPFKIIKYLDEPLTIKNLETIVEKLKIEPIALVRTKEKEWKENYSHKNLTNNEILKILVENPRFIERPIIVNGEKAVIARPTEKIDDVL